MNRQKQRLYRIAVGGREVYLGWTTPQRIKEIAKGYGDRAKVERVKEGR